MPITDFLLFEGTSNLKKQYVDTGKLEQEEFDEIKKLDPSKTKKYLGWMIRVYLSNEGFEIENLQDYVYKYDKMATKGIIKTKDINSYKSFDALKRDVDRHRSIKTTTEEKRSVEKVFENDEWKVIVPKTHKASRSYGADTDWCTSYKSRDHWDEFQESGAILYYILSKSRKGKYAIAIYPGGYKECYDAKNNNVSFREVLKITSIPKEVFSSP